MKSSALLLPSPPASNLAWLDGLRGLAILSVMLYHLWPAGVPSGFLGVDVFFVISGYIVTRASLEKSVMRFYADRIARVLPLLLLVLVSSFVLSTLFIPNAWITSTLDATGLAALLAYSNWQIYAAHADYFSPVSDFNPFLHTWSLGVEEQFYLVFPALLGLMHAIGRRWRWGHALAVLLAIALISLAYAWIFRAKAPQLFFDSGARAWQLLLGMAVALMLSQSSGHLEQGFGGVRNHGIRPIGQSSLRLGRMTLSEGQAGGIVGGLLLLMVVIMVFPKAWMQQQIPVRWQSFSAFEHPVLWSALAGLTVGAVIVLQVLHQRAETRGGAHASLAGFTHPKPLQLLGQHSYALYLWHWPVFVLFRWTVGLEQAWTMLAALALSLALAWGSFWALEMPLRAWLKRQAPWVAFVFAATALAVAYPFAHWLTQAKPRLSQSLVVQQAADWYPNAVGTPSFVPQGLDRVSPELFRGRRLIVVGDSHALHYRELFTHTARWAGMELRILANGGCPFLPYIPNPALAPQCGPHERESVAYIRREARRGDVVVVASLRVHRLVNQWGPQLRADQVINAMRLPEIGAFMNAQNTWFVEQFGDLARSGVHFVFPAPTPMMPFNPFRCADWFNKHHPACRQQHIDRESFEAMRAPSLAALELLAATLEGAAVWDPTPWLCSASICGPYEGAMPQYFDGDHLSAYTNRKLVTPFVTWLEPRLSKLY